MGSPPKLLRKWFADSKFFRQFRFSLSDNRRPVSGFRHCCFFWNIACVFNHFGDTWEMLFGRRISVDAASSESADLLPPEAKRRKTNDVR
jgi:hypothetical protein